MSEFSESRWDALFINADCTVKKGEQRENINEKKNLWSVLTLSCQHSVSIAPAVCVQTSHRTWIISKKKKKEVEVVERQDSCCLLYQSFRALPSGWKRGGKKKISGSWNWCVSWYSLVQINRMMLRNGPELLLEFFEQKLPKHAGEKSNSLKKRVKISPSHVSFHYTQDGSRSEVGSWLITSNLTGPVLQHGCQHIWEEKLCVVSLTRSCGNKSEQSAELKELSLLSGLLKSGTCFWGLW